MNFKRRIGFRPIRSAIPLLLVVMLVGLSAFGQERSFVISGRVVDEAGSPISNALVTLFVPPDAAAFELIMPGARSLPGGEFFIDSGSVIQSQKLRLFIEEPVPQGFWSPFNGPPFGKLSRFPPFRGIALKLDAKQTRVDLGEVQAGIRYAKIVMDLTKVWSTKDKPSLGELRQGKLIISDVLGNRVYDGRIPESALDLASFSLNLALTKGRWMVELSAPGLPQSPRRVINVKNLSCSRVTLTEKHIQKPCE